MTLLANVKRPGLLTALLLLFFTALAHAQEPEPTTCKEWNERVEKLYGKGKFVDACKAAEKAVEICGKEPGMEHEGYAEALVSYGNACAISTKGDYKGALDSFNKALAIFNARLPKDNPELGALYASMSGANFYLGNFEQAHHYVDLALENAEINHLQDSAVYGNRLLTKGGIFLSQDRIEEALPFLEKSLDIAAKTTGKNNSQWASSALFVAAMKYKQGKPEEAKFLALEILDATKDVLGEENMIYATTENLLGSICSVLKQLEEAEAYLLSALAKTKRNNYGSQPDPSAILNNLAYVYQCMGQYSKAISMFEEALNLAEKKQSTRHPDFIVLIQNISQCYLKNGEYDKGLPMAERGWHLLVDSLKTPYTYPGLLLAINLATTTRILGLCSQAEAWLKKGFEIADSIQLPKMHPDRLKLLLAQLQLYKEQNKIKDSQRILEQALAEIPQNQKQYQDIYHLLMQERGQIFFAEKNYAAAVKGFQKAEDAYRENHYLSPDFGPLLHNIAFGYEKLNNPEKAETYYRKAIAWHETAFSTQANGFIGTLLFFSDFLEKRNSIAESYSVLKKADSLLRSQLQRDFSILSSQGKELRLSDLDDKFGQIRDFTWRFRAKYPEAQWMALRNTMLLNGLVQRSTNSMRAKIRRSGNTVLLQQYETWTALNAQISHDLTSPDSLRRFTLVQVDSLQGVADRLEKELSRQSAAFRSTFVSLPYDTLAGALESIEAAVQFSHYTELEHPNDPARTWYVAFVTRKGYPYPTMFRLCTQDQLGAKISTRSAYECRKMYSKGPGSLYELIWKPLEEHLKGVRTVYYIPDGLLHQINFAAMEIDSGEVLLNRYDLFALGSLTDLLGDNFDVPFNEIKTALLTGGLDFENEPLLTTVDSNRDAAQPLPYSDVEIDSCEESLRKALVFTMTCRKNQASESLYKSFGNRLPSPDLLHFATHAKAGSRTWVNPQSPCETPLEQYPLNQVRLYLSGSDPAAPFQERRAAQTHDQVLYGSEIAACDFSHTKLVVLSACESGVGDIRGMEGAYGLQRAFRVAGAEHVISSLWSVNDRSSSAFMIALYANWQKRKDGSLRHAFLETQRQMYRLNAEKGPYYWAMFVLN